MRWFLLIALTGCGGVTPVSPEQQAKIAATWAGAYSGTVEDLTACSDGTGGQPRTIPAEWTIEALDGGSVRVGWVDSPCQALTAHPNEETADVTTKNCPAFVANGRTFAPVVQDGRLALSGDSLTAVINLRSNWTTQDGGEGDCAIRHTATLTRK